MDLPVAGTGTAGTSSARVTISGVFNGIAPGGTLRDDTLSNSGSPLKVEEVALAAGWNAFTVPGGAKLLRIVPPSDNEETLTLKGVTGDTGVELDETLGGLLSLKTGTTAVGITAGDTVTVQLIWL
jgi:hypothetical protein